MKQMIDYEATIKSFFEDAISWLEKRPVRMRAGEYKEKKTYNYMKMVQSDPRKYTVGNAVYMHCEDLDGFVEYSTDKKGYIVTNNDLYLAVVRVLDAVGKYYDNSYQYTQTELVYNIKQFQVALNRGNLLKSTLYKMKAPYYFAQKQK